MQIDIVSDVSCPWCVIGYKGLEKAIADLGWQEQVEVKWHPFELNPTMPKEGQEINEHLGQKYGINQQQIDQNREHIHQRGADVGFEFGHRGGGRIFNTFDAHRLLNWAAEQGKQTELKLAFFDLYFKQGGNPSDHKQLLDCVVKVGLDDERAANILGSTEYESDVRQEQQKFQGMGISSVPAFIINNKYLISGGQPPEAFVQALSDIDKKEQQ